MSGDGVKTEHKDWWKSRTLWLNALGAVQLFAPLLPVDPITVGKILVLGNAALRFNTSQPILLK
jgi:hypothetical protein